MSELKKRFCFASIYYRRYPLWVAALAALLHPVFPLPMDAPPPQQPKEEKLGLKRKGPHPVLFF